MKVAIGVAAVVLVLVLPATSSGGVNWLFCDRGTPGAWDSGWKPSDVSDICAPTRLAGECMGGCGADIGPGGSFRLRQYPLTTVHYGPNCLIGDMPTGAYYLNLYVYSPLPDTVSLSVTLHAGSCFLLCETTRKLLSWTGLPILPGLNEYHYPADGLLGTPVHLFEERPWLSFNPSVDNVLELYWGMDHPSALELPFPFFHQGDWPWGACCYPDESCDFLHGSNCDPEDWTDGLECQPQNPCHVVPAGRPTWGLIKTMGGYR